MFLDFSSDTQAHLFEAVFQRIERLGYRKELILKEYGFVNWFDPFTPSRSVPLAAFATEPPSYNTACIGVVIPNRAHGSQLVKGVRALGAPYVLEIGQNRVIPWIVGKDESRTKPEPAFGLGDIDRVFGENKERWSAKTILRDKNIAIRPGPRQLDFIDLGLIPAIEENVRTKLHAYIKESIYSARQAYIQAFRKAPEGSS